MMRRSRRRCKAACSGALYCMCLRGLIVCHYIMFVQFRQSRRRLQASLIETRRVGAKVQHEHIAGLGAVNLSPSVADRMSFWEGVHQGLDKLSNRLDATAQGKILAALHARVPIVAVEEIRALQLENAQADERSWSALRDMHQGMLDDNRALAAKIENTIADAQAGVDMSAAGSCRRRRKGCQDQGGAGRVRRRRQSNRSSPTIARSRVVNRRLHERAHVRKNRRPRRVGRISRGDALLPRASSARGGEGIPWKLRRRAPA